MANKSIKISIATALNAVGITAAKRALSSLASQTKSFSKAVASNLMNIKAGFDMVAACARKFLDAMSKGMEFERMTVTFKSLTGSMELAKAHMKDLQDLGRTPPFSLEQFAAASQAMMKMTGGMAGYKREMQIVGDMAAATGNDIATVGRAFGLAYQVIRDGQDFGRAGQQLYSLGLMTKKQVAEFAELSKAGTDNVAVWQKLQAVFARYSGAMAETEKTAKGMVEAIQGEATVAVTTFSQAVTETAKPALDGLLGLLKRINEDGTIELWASKAVSAMSKIADATKPLIAFVTKLVDQYTKVRDVLDQVGGSFGAWVGARHGGASFGEALDMASDELTNIRKEQKERAIKAEEEAVAKAQERMKKRAVESAKAEAEAKKRITEDMARAQFETQWKADVERWKKEHEESKKIAEEDAKLQQRLEDEIRRATEDEAKRENERIQEAAKLENEKRKELHAKKMRDLDEEARKTQEMIDRLLARGADNPMARAGGGGWQRDELRAERQKKIDDARVKKAIDAAGGDDARVKKAIDAAGGDNALANLEGKMKKGGRLSNLERAILEKLQLDKARKEAAEIAKKKEDADNQMRANIAKIAKQLDGVGL